MADLQKINQSIEHLIQSLLELKEKIGDDQTEFEKLSSMLKSSTWPEAVHPSLICDRNSESDQIERARGIIELVVEESLQDKKFLDFGCGNGFVTKIAKDYETQLAIGFDLVKNWDHENNEHTILTTNLDVVQENGPYDVILLFDVLDHSKTTSPDGLLKRLKELLSDNGRIYVRCHPFASRHATHLYQKLNKAYIHLIFSDEELESLIDSYEPEHNIGVTTPIRSYGNFIEQSDLKIVRKQELFQPVEDFFKNPLIVNRILQKTNFNELPEFQMSIQFIDYILEKGQET